MSILSIHFLGRFLKRFAFLFALIQVFLALAAAVSFLPAHPYVPPDRMLAGLPDLLLALMPGTLPFAMTAAAALFADDVRRQKGFLHIELAGRDPRRFLWPILGLGLLAAVLLYLFNAHVLPRVLFHNRYSLAAPEDSPAALALLIEKDPELIKGFNISFDSLDQDRLTNVSIVSIRDKTILVSADEAYVSLDRQNQLFELRLDKGRIISLGPEGSLEDNAMFDGFVVRLDSRGLFGGDKSGLQSPLFYTDGELDMVPELIKYQERRGIIMRPKLKKRLDRAIAQVRAARIQSAANPFLFLFLTLCALFVHIPEHARRWTVIVPGLCLLAILPQQVFMEAMADRGQLPGAWAAFIPGLESIVLLGVLAAIGPVRRRPA